MGVIAIIYSYTGGLKSVLWTDFIQGSVLLIGVTFALIFLIFHIDGGMGSIFGAFSGRKFLGGDEAIFDWNFLKNSVFIIIVGMVLIHVPLYISSQDIVQRFTTTIDTKKLNKMMFYERCTFHFHCDRIFCPFLIRLEPLQKTKPHGCPFR